MLRSIFQHLNEAHAEAVTNMSDRMTQQLLHSDARAQGVAGEFGEQALAL